MPLPAYERLISEGRIDPKHEITLMRMHRVAAECLGGAGASDELAEWFTDIWDHVIAAGLEPPEQFLLLDLIHPNWSKVEPQADWHDVTDKEINDLCERVASLLLTAPAPGRGG